MGIIGCPENPVATNFSYPVNATNDVKFGFNPNFPQEIPLFTTDSLAWKKFVPTFNGMSLGANRINFSKYRLVRNSYIPEGAFCDISWKLEFDFDATFAVGNWQVSFPPGMTPFDYTTAFSNKLPIIGQWLAHDASANSFYEGRMFLGASPTSFPARFARGDDTGAVNNQITSTTPFTWAAGDRLTAVARVRVTIP